ncbi:MAG: cell division protein FtsL [Rhodospirillales bacterium]|nr:cell division protein FtsL [Acetobacter sp.]
MAAAAFPTGSLTQTSARPYSRRENSGRPASIAALNRERFEVQRFQRRGPTPEMFFAKHIDNSRIVKADDPVRRREVRTFTVAMSVLFALTMIYVWQHFSAIEVGYRVEAQKTQVELLREQNRQLRLTEAQLSDPGRIDRIAKQLGLDVPLPGQVVRPEGPFNAEQPVLAQNHAPVPATLPN